MGFRPREVRELTLREFNLSLTGYFRRQEQEWNRTRHIMAYILNYGGMGAREFYRPQDIWPLRMDAENIKRMITTQKQAQEMWHQFWEAAQK